MHQLSGPPDPFSLACTPLELFGQIFDDYPEGVTVYDVHTRVIYYNRAQGLLDDLDPQHALGKTLLELYRVGDNSSFPTLHCLFKKQPLINQPCYYYTHRGKLINSIHNIFPLIQNGALSGCVCLIRDYGQMAGQYHAVQNLGAAPAPDDSGAGARTRDRVKYTFDEIVTQSPMMRKSLEIAARSANSPSSVFLYGETGCGKEMFAQAIHNISSRRNRPFMAVNCAAIPESLLEGLLFGTVRGAFTGAQDKPGLLELADGGTIFLDEINSMPLGLQSKMLRAIQEKTIRRVGGSTEKPINLKIVSAANEPPQKAVAAGTLRPDLLFRLGVVTIRLYPLRERPEDLPLLTRHFIKKLNRRLSKRIISLSADMEKRFRDYAWPGNVRELEHALEGAMNMVSAGEETLQPEHFGASLIGGEWLEGFARLTEADYRPGERRLERPDGGGLAEKVTSNEPEILLKALADCGGVAARAARSLNISPQLMQYKMKKYGLKSRLSVTIREIAE